MSDPGLQRSRSFGPWPQDDTLLPKHLCSKTRYNLRLITEANEDT